MKILPWLCLSLSQLLKTDLGLSTAENPLDLLPVTRQGPALPLPAVLRLSDGEQSHCPELLSPFLVFVIPVPVSGLFQADAKAQPRAGSFGPQ